MLLIFVGFWKNVKVWRQNMRKTMSTCDKSFTRSGNSKVSSLKPQIHTDIDLSQFQKKSSDLISGNTSLIIVYDEFAAIFW